MKMGYNDDCDFQCMLLDPFPFGFRTDSMINRDAIFGPLNEAQREAVAHLEGPLLTLAGPGSGKTRVVTHRIANLLLEGVSPYSILALTFTNKAAGEMKKRLKHMVGDVPVWMGTFHGYCAKFLRTHHQYVGLPPNFSIFDPSDSKSALKMAIETAQVSLTHLNFDSIQRQISNLKNRLVTPEGLASLPQDHETKILSAVYPAYQSLLLKCGAVDFDDLLLHTAVLLRSNNDLRQHLDAAHRFILVDEYQDTNTAQYAIVRALAYDFPNLNVTGDPDQSVYGWRGADISNILNFERDYRNVKVVRLEQNYRSTPQILSAADNVIHYNRQRKEKTLIPTREKGAKVSLAIYPSDRDEANEIADQIQTAMIDEGKFPGDFAILYRTNAQSRLFEKALLARKINFQLIGGFRFYQRQEIKDLLAYLTLVMNPTDDIAFDRVINTPTRGLGDKAIEKIRDMAKTRSLALLSATRFAVSVKLLSPKATKGAAEFLKLYDELVELSTGSLTELLSHLLKQTDYVQYLQGRKTDAPDGSVEENVNELLSDARQMDQEFPPGEVLGAFLEQVSLVSDTDQLDAGQGKVTLMTLHSCKGLEFPNVYLVAVEHGILPHKRSFDDPRQLEEERRLFFVGMTRAMDRLQISMAHVRGYNQNSPTAGSRFLMELPRLELEHRDFTQPQFMDEDSWDREVARPFSKRRSLEDDSNEVHEVPDTWDEACQLPAEEIAVRLRSVSKGRSKGNTLGGLRTGAEIEPPSGAMWRQGASVQHPEYGIGTIVSIAGSGLKRIARVHFEASGTVHSLVVAKSKLELVDD